MDVTLRPATEQMAMLRMGTISALELAEEHIRRIERLNPSLHALVEFDADAVRVQARAAKPGILCGLPLTIKSSIEVEGMRCEIGSTLLRGTVAAQDAEVVARLRAAGAVVLGTTNCPEFLMAYDTNNLLHGRTNNPWDLARSAGGSSGGESAAIAAGLSAGGLGSDSGGSVRLPAHFTGICALKPTPGRIPSWGHQPPCVGPFTTLGSLGPMARTIADVELLFRVLSGGGEGDAASPPVAYRPVLTAEAKQRTIGWFEDDDLIPVTQQTREAVQSAARELERQGFRVRPLRPEGLEEARRLWRVFFLQCGAMFYQSMIEGKGDQLSPIFREFLQEEAGETPLTASSLLAAWAEMDLLRARFWAQLQDCSLLLTPVCAVPAFLHGERSFSIEGRTVGYWDAMRFTQWFNLLASPAAVVPVGASPEGLPIGVQIAGAPFQDELVLTVAGALDRAFGYRVPVLAS